MKTRKVTRIPAPGFILRGDWKGIVYAIETEGSSIEEHEKTVSDEIEKIEDEFDENNHDSVSLRLVKKEVAYINREFSEFVTLVQFRVRDSY